MRAAPSYEKYRLAGAIKKLELSPELSVPADSFPLYGLTLDIPLGIAGGVAGRRAKTRRIQRFEAA